MAGNEAFRGLGELFGPEMHGDPYPFYRVLQSDDPVHWSDRFQVWILTRYGDVAAALRDSRLGTNRFGSIEVLKDRGLVEVVPIFQTLANMMLFSDPPKHSRLRGTVQQVLTPRLVDSMREPIQWIVDALIDRVLAREEPSSPTGTDDPEFRAPPGRMDLIRDVAYPLPSVVVGEMMGIPAADRERFRRWWYDVMAFLKVVDSDLDGERPALESIVELTEYVRGVFASVREHPREDVVGALAASELEGARLTEDELFANCVLLLSAGQESTTNLVGNGMLALLQDPRELDRLRSDPSLVEPAVEEFLRYDSPVQFTGRQARESLEIGGRRIERGQYVLLVLGAANRDPHEFANPDHLDIGRRNNRHLAFGHGPHFCLGSQLARLEGQIAFETLLRRLPDLELDCKELRWRETMSSRGLKSLPVRFGGRVGPRTGQSELGKSGAKP